MTANVFKLAIAEGHPLFLKGLEAVIKYMDDVDLVFAVRNEKELIGKIECQLPDVIFMDLRMPILEGIKTISCIKQQYPNIKIVVYSFYDAEFIIAKLMSIGANGFLRKSADIDEIKTAIYTVIHKDVYYSKYVLKAMENELPNKLKAGYDIVTRLKQKELVALMLICKGCSTTEIAKEMYLSPRTVEDYRKKIMEKLGVDNTAGLIMSAIAYNLVDINLSAETP